MLLRQFVLQYFAYNLSCNNLHIRENTDFPWQKSLQLLSAEANFDGCIHITILASSYQYTKLASALS